MIFTKRHILHYKEKDDRFFFSNLSYVNVMNPKQVYDPKLVLFSLITCIVWFM